MNHSSRGYDENSSMQRKILHFLRKLQFVLTYRDAEVVKNIAVHKFMAIVVLVRWKKLTAQFVVFKEGPQVEWETQRSFQTGKRALAHVINEISSKNRDVQVREFLFHEVDITYTTVGSTADNFARFL